MSGGATLGNLPLPAYFFLVEFRFCLYRARGKTLRCIMGRQTLLIHPLRIFAVGKGNSRPILPCVAASKRRAARRPASHQNLLREIGSRFPLARTSKYSHSRLRQKANPKITPREEGKTRFWIARCRVCKRIHFTQLGCQGSRMHSWRAAGAVFGSTAISIPALPV